MIDCISLHQPWAQWAALGWKKIETRRHNKLACLARRGKRIVIHAADKWDRDWFGMSRGFLTKEQVWETEQSKDRWPRGALICTAFPAEHRPLIWSDSDQALCECGYNDLFGVVLEDVQRFDPIKWTGHQGIMKIPDEVIRHAM